MSSENKNNTLFKRILKFFNNYYVLRFFLLFLVGLIVWFVGPAISIYGQYFLESTFSRFFFILSFIFGLVIYETVKWLKIRKNNQALLNALSDSEIESNQRVSADLKVLQERMSAAVQVLKKQKLNGFNGESKTIHDLPWYLFIGAPGSGKTTALKNCGLKFPLASKDGLLAIKGVGGTRNCDWWFTNDAVFLDTAGRFTTQDSDARADSKAWLGFLEILKKSRKDTPINGAFITLSVSDILTSSTSEFKQYAESVKSRVNELYEILGVRFPVYLLVTKVDLLAGFSQFFSTYGLEERSQIWGFTFPFGNNDLSIIERYHAEFKELEMNLYSRVTERMSLEKDVEFRSSIYNFPQQFSAIHNQIGQFIDFVFSSSRFEDGAMLRGVYFTSGTQEGSPIDRVLGGLSRSLNIQHKVLPPSNSTGKSYFLRDLLRNLVFLESGLVTYNKKEIRLKNNIFSYGLLAVIFGTVIVSSLLGFSYFKNQKILIETNEMVSQSLIDLKKFNSSKDDLVEVVKLLNSIRDLPFGYLNKDHSTNLFSRMGLSQSDRLGEEADNSYHRLIGQSLLPKLAELLENQLKNPVDDQVLYEALKAYLMLYDDSHLDPLTIEAWGYRLLPQADQTIQHDLVTHLKAATTQRPIFISHQKNIDLIEEARIKLKTISLAERVFSRLTLVSNLENFKPFTISAAAGPAALQVFTLASGRPLDTQISPIFTRDGYFKSIRSISEKLVKELFDEEVWVLNKNDSDVINQRLTQEVIEEVKRLYFTEYIKNWDNLLLDIRVKKASTISETILQSRVLSGADSPLKKLIIAIKNETKLIDENTSNKSKDNVIDVVKNATQKIVENVSGLSNIQENNSFVAEKLVDDHFARIHQLIADDPAQPSPLDQSISLLNEFSKELADLESKLFNDSASIRGLPTAIRLKAEADFNPPPVQNILNSLIESSNTLASAVNQQVLKQGAKSASELCLKAISGKYPFNKNSRDEVAYDDFNSVFKAGGDLDTFFKENMSTLVDTSSSNWRLKPGAESLANISNDMLRNFQRADVIRKAFFKGSPYAGFSLDVAFQNTDSGQYTFEYDGELYKLGPGQVNTFKIRWPGQRPFQPARVYKGWGKAESSTNGFEGTWSLFKLIDLSNRSISRDITKLVFDLDGQKVSFDLKSSSIYNPIILKELAMFICPGRG